MKARTKRSRRKFAMKSWKGECSLCRVYVVSELPLPAENGCASRGATGRRDGAHKKATESVQILGNPYKVYPGFFTNQIEIVNCLLHPKELHPGFVEN